MFLTGAPKGLKPIRPAKSQSPQIGSMFLTRIVVSEMQVEGHPDVAIPSNRVNVSYVNVKTIKPLKYLKSQSPQIGSMFLTRAIKQRWEIK